MIRLVLIDFDDTLVLTEEACFYLENEIAATFGLPPMTREVHQQNWGTPFREAIGERFPGIDPDVFIEEHKVALPRYVEQGLIDGVSEENLAVLQAFRTKGRKVAILTSRTAHEVEHLLHEDHALSSVIDGFYHGGNLEYTKPDPKVFDKPLKDFEASSHEVVYIGDSPSDGVAAKGAGLHFIAYLESGLRTPEDFAAIDVDAFAYSFDEIPGLIEAMD